MLDASPSQRWARSSPPKFCYANHAILSVLYIMTKKIIKKKVSKKKIIKKVVKKNIKIKQPKPIGLVTHYFSNIKVAVIKLKDNLKEAQEIRIVGGEKTDFKQVVKSMQVDHKPVKLAKKGKSIGLKVKEHVREGYKVFKS
ncbi:MAG: hypothetical protein UR22_C0030G0011 [Parcubacteria group bacterium GW2011_GWC2_32_10]|nr:MAG: hypothetical protein UR22_C0030G0011 [Parcubacteria group bacterium GW2011_GWC2_32_10]